MLGRDQQRLGLFRLDPALVFGTCLSEGGGESVSQLFGRLD
jgi:hypothetical protein